MALCESQAFDIVLMDVRMPGIDGIEAFRLIRRHCIGVKVIMMSAYSIEDLKKQALDDGAIAFLPKPLDLLALFVVLALSGFVAMYRLYESLDPIIYPIFKWIEVIGALIALPLKNKVRPAVKKYKANISILPAI